MGKLLGEFENCSKLMQPKRTMSKPLKNYYDILSVSSNASSDDIKKKYRQLAKKFHPDKNTSGKEGDQVFKDINEAYHCLADKESRQKYDDLLALNRRRSEHFAGSGRNFSGWILNHVQGHSILLRNSDIKLRFFK